MEQQERWDAFLSRIYKEMYARLLRYAQLHLGEQALAEEAVQEAFRIACLRNREFCTSENPQGWIMRTLQNVICNTQRQQRQLSRLFTASPDGGAADSAAPDDYSAVEFGDLLPPEDMALLRRIAVDRYSMKEAAEELGISVEACKKRVQRIRGRVRRKLEEIEGGGAVPADDEATEKEVSGNV